MSVFKKISSVLLENIHSCIAVHSLQSGRVHDLKLLYEWVTHLLSSLAGFIHSTLALYELQNIPICFLPIAWWCIFFYVDWLFTTEGLSKLDWNHCYFSFSATYFQWKFPIFLILRWLTVYFWGFIQIINWNHYYFFHLQQRTFNLSMKISVSFSAKKSFCILRKFIITASDIFWGKIFKVHSGSFYSDRWSCINDV